MKMISAIIKPFKLDDVRAALTELGVEGMTITEVKGYGRQKGQTESFRGNDYATNFLPKIKLEIAVPAKLADKVVAAIIESANTGRIGDGKVFVYDLQKAIRIRTGETGNDAL
ncbi:MAG: P-II family nitrogen regulator [Rhodospirillales bacterium]|nr:P-II family nitrogen regulator [Rhodospirillales bacterium]